MENQVDWRHIDTIRNHVRFPEQLPGGSWYAIYRTDIMDLIRMIEWLTKQVKDDDRLRD